jgi:hypothetical protein
MEFERDVFLNLLVFRKNINRLQMGRDEFKC